MLNSAPIDASAVRSHMCEKLQLNPKIEGSDLYEKHTLLKALLYGENPISFTEFSGCLSLAKMHLMPMKEPKFITKSTVDVQRPLVMFLLLPQVSRCTNRQYTLHCFHPCEKSRGS